MNNLSKITKIIFFNLFVFVLFFLCAEVIARLYVHFFIEEKRFFRESNFICPWITSYDYPPPRMESPEKGYFRNRKNAVLLKKKLKQIRIIAVGGSTILNAIPFKSSGIDFTAQLENDLYSAYGDLDFEILNAGADAYSTAQSLINIQFRLVDFEPDIIILMHNINDRTVNYFLNGALGDYSNKYLQEYFINPELTTGLSISGLLYQSRLLTAIGLPQYVAKKRDVNVSNSIENGLKFFKRNLTYISNIAKINKIDLILLTQPHQMKNFMFDGEKEQIILYNDAVRQVAEQEKLYFIDMFNYFGHDQTLFIDTVHYNEKGVIKFAKILLQHLTMIIDMEKYRTRINN